MTELSAVQTEFFSLRFRTLSAFRRSRYGAP
jgi:hypothetical protein